jgi:DNA-binding transcriptional ArsR family regulator
MRIRGEIPDLQKSPCAIILSDMRERDPLELTDPRQMRALAHPLRLRLLGLLRTDGPAIATDLGEELGASPALVSYHLRALAKHGFINEAPDLARDGRERWWRASHRGITWEPAHLLDTPERSAAAGALLSEIADRYAELAHAWLADAQNWPGEWVGVSDMSDWKLELTAEQAGRMRKELVEVIERYGALPPDDGAEPLSVIVHVLPRRRKGRR